MGTGQAAGSHRRRRTRSPRFPAACGSCRARRRTPTPSDTGPACRGGV